MGVKVLVVMHGADLKVQYCTVLLPLVVMHGADLKVISQDLIGKAMGGVTLS